MKQSFSHGRTHSVVVETKKTRVLRRPGDPAPVEETPVAAPAPAEHRCQADSFTSARTYAAVAPPVRLRIPALGVDSRLDRLGLQKDGSVEVPERVTATIRS